MKIAVWLKHSLMHRINWWPSLIREQARDDKIIEYPMLDLDMLVASFLRELHSEGDKVISLKFKGVDMIRLWEASRKSGVELDEEYLLEGAIYLFAGIPNFMKRMFEWMEKKGYDFGEYDNIE